MRERVTGIEVAAVDDHRVLLGVQLPGVTEFFGEALEDEMFDVFTINEGVIVRSDEFKTRDDALIFTRNTPAPSQVGQGRNANQAPISRGPRVERVVPILNVPDLMSSARTRGGLRVGRESRPERTSARRILICEDSFTTRELERSIFEAAGYDVEIANDGASGLKKLKEGTRIDAVVTDVQMPNMTGFELTRAIKDDPLLAPIPVVIVTSLERDEEKSEGVRAGADAYITKSVFNQDTLVDTIERLIR